MDASSGMQARTDVKSRAVALLLIGLATTTTGFTQSDTPTATANPVTRPDWIRKPSGRDLARLYPEEAMRRNIGGDVVVSCAISEAGTLTDCVTTQEEPKDLGFGEATIRLAAIFKMRP